MAAEHKATERKAGLHRQAKASVTGPLFAEFESIVCMPLATVEQREQAAVASKVRKVKRAVRTGTKTIPAGARCLTPARPPIAVGQDSMAAGLGHISFGSPWSPEAFCEQARIAQTHPFDIAFVAEDAIAHNVF